MHLCLFEDDRVERLRPLVETRAAYDLRLGVRTLLETARAVFDPKGLALHARPYLRDVTAQRHDEVPVNTMPVDTDILFVNGRLVANGSEALSELKEAPERDRPRLYLQGEILVAAWIPGSARPLPEDPLSEPQITPSTFGDLPVTTLDDATIVEYPWNLLDTLPPALRRDIDSHVGSAPPSFPLAQRPYATVHDSVTSVNPERIHLGDGAVIQPGAVLNAHDGPIYIGANAEVHEQAVVRGPCAIGHNTMVKTAANVEASAVGPVCKIAGEVQGTVIQGYSNKSHPGYLGDSYLGTWCNLGADTNNSNLKNDYGEVTAYSPVAQRLVGTGRQFAGLFMGDHSKCGINTMFNTGTVVGTNCNIFGGDFPPRYVPPFSWGGPSDGFTEYRLDKALKVAERVMARREVALTDADRTVLQYLIDETAEEREAHHR